MDKQIISHVPQLLLQKLHACLSGGLDAEVEEQATITEQDAMHRDTLASIPGKDHMELLAAVITVGAVVNYKWSIKHDNFSYLQSPTFCPLVPTMKSRLVVICKFTALHDVAEQLLDKCLLLLELLSYCMRRPEAILRRKVTYVLK